MEKAIYIQGTFVKPVKILLADDDREDCYLARKALEKNKGFNEVKFVHDGEELLDYLYQRGIYTEGEAMVPDIILLDLNMPKISGKEALKIIKADPDLKHIPIVILTTSKEEQDIFKSYNLGANSYVTKPVSFDQLVNVMQAIEAFWFLIAALPTKTLQM